MIVVVITCTIDNSKANGKGILIKSGIALITGILFKITKTNSPNIEIKKNNIERNIDCII